MKDISLIYYTRVFFGSSATVVASYQLIHLVESLLLS